MNLEESIMALSRGENQALESIYLEMKNAVFALCFSITGNYSNSQDLMHDTFIKVKKYILYYKPNSNPKAWILTIAKNTCYNYLKSRKKELLTDFEMDIEDHKAFKIHDETGVISLAKKTLKKTELQIVLLHTIGDIKFKDIAKILTVNFATVRWKYNVAIKKIQKAYEKEEQDE